MIRMVMMLIGENSRGIGNPRNTRQTGDRRSGNPEERHEHRIARAEIHVGQVIERQSLSQYAQHRTQPFLS